MERGRTQIGSGHFKAFLACAGLLGVGVAAAFLMAASPAPRFLQEDAFVENLTVLFCLVGATIALGAAMMGQPRVQRTALLGIAGISLLLVLEELSFAERIFGFAPRILGIKIDAMHRLTSALSWAQSHGGRSLRCERSCNRCGAGQRAAMSGSVSCLAGSR
jgi:hypothetical protein